MEIQPKRMQTGMFWGEGEGGKGGVQSERHFKSWKKNENQ